MSSVEICSPTQLFCCFPRRRSAPPLGRSRLRGRTCSHRPRSPPSASLAAAFLGPLPRHVLLPLVRALVAVRPLAQFPKLLAGLGLANGLERHLEWFPGPLGAGFCLASQDLVGHLGYSLFLFHGLLLPGGPPCGGNGTILPCPLVTISKLAVVPTVGPV